jgi:hypothetical protein
LLGLGGYEMQGFLLSKRLQYGTSLHGFLYAQLHYLSIQLRADAILISGNHSLLACISLAERTNRNHVSLAAA